MFHTLGEYNNLITGAIGSIRLKLPIDLFLRMLLSNMGDFNSDLHSTSSFSSSDYESSFQLLADILQGCTEVG